MVEFTDRAEGDLAALLDHQGFAARVVRDLGIGARPGRAGTYAPLLELFHQPAHRRVRGPGGEALVDERVRDSTQRRRTSGLLVALAVLLLDDEHTFPSEHCGHIQRADEARILLDVPAMLVVLVIGGEHRQVVLGEELVDLPTQLAVGLLHCREAWRYVGPRTVGTVRATGLDMARAGAAVAQRRRIHSDDAGDRVDRGK